MAKILVIDDEEDIRIVLRQLLELEGFDVCVAANGREGLAVLEREGVDLVITDIIMPGMDGVATLERIKRNRPNLPVIVISGGGNIAPLAYEPGAISTSAYLASAKEAGADSTLTKPFDRHEIMTAINRLISPGDMAPTSG